MSLLQSVGGPLFGSLGGKRVEIRYREDKRAQKKAVLLGRKRHRTPPLRLPSAFGGRWWACVPLGLVSREFLQSLRHVLRCCLAVGAAHRSRRVSSDGVMNALCNAVPFSNLLESVAPRVVRLNFGISDAELAHPLRNSVARL